jgi:hypothetical protein
MWTSVSGTTLSFYVNTLTDEEFTRENKEDGHEMFILLSPPRGTAVRVDLTALTEAELTAFKYVIDVACANALHICKKRDEVAEAALDEGSTKYTRVFREWPRILLREGTKEFEKYPVLKRLWDGESGSKLVQRFGVDKEKADGNSDTE